VGPGRVIPGLAVSWELTTTATEEVVGLRTRVNDLSGDNAIIPALLTDASRLTANGDIKSREASTILRAGEPVLTATVDRGLDTNARNFSPLGTCLVGVEDL
jgi:hypothetical protein